MNFLARKIFIQSLDYRRSFHRMGKFINPDSRLKNYFFTLELRRVCCSSEKYKQIHLNVYFIFFLSLGCCFGCICTHSILSILINYMYLYNELWIEFLPHQHIHHSEDFNCWWMIFTLSLALFRVLCVPRVLPCAGSNN